MRHYMLDFIPLCERINNGCTCKAYQSNSYLKRKGTSRQNSTYIRLPKQASLDIKVVESPPSWETLIITLLLRALSSWLDKCQIFCAKKPILSEVNLSYFIENCNSGSHLRWVLDHTQPI